MKYILLVLKSTFFLSLFLCAKNGESLKHTNAKLLFVHNNTDFFQNDGLSVLRNKTSAQNRKKVFRFKLQTLRDQKDGEVHYELTSENVEKVLNLIRPKLQTDNGDVELVDIKNNNLYIKLLGNCVTCSSNSVTVSQVIKKTLKMYIRNKNNEEPNVIIINFDEINEENIYNCLSDLKPYFDFLKVKVIIKDLINNKENINNSVSLTFKNIDTSIDSERGKNGETEQVKIPFSVKSEITERLKQKFPSLTVNFEN
ncbi:NifU-like scaffold protein [Plasmodium gonderi]|uniref:NifU-like scaffold protein n=1 Tax=Plasmodium gonderi TaxID=77519 RepID=A0A1Y1JGE9_PLAGO|nr:NifU-like scaffold protein [Plasmodium gonderi]GAW80277.1 NifU-like scaffold protein [Plasmodium gonderi]